MLMCDLLFNDYFIICIPHNDSKSSFISPLPLISNAINGGNILTFSNKHVAASVTM